MASNIKVDIVRPTATNGSLSLKGDSGGSATTNGVTINSSGDTAITGTTTVSSLVATTADINGGSVDNVTLGTNSAVTEAQVDHININGNTISSTNTDGDINLTPNGNGSAVVTSGGTGDALRITQTGTGNALVVEDDTNPDSSPFVVDATGKVGIGTDSPACKLHLSESGAVNAAAVNFSVDGLDSTFGSNLVKSSGAYTTPATNISGGAWEYRSVNSSNSHGEMLYLSAPDTNSSSSTPVERMRIDNSGNLKFDSGYGSAATAYGCRAWVNFNGTGTVAIRDSGNVSSITDNGTGNYTVNFTNAMPDANYCAVGSTFGTTNASYATFLNGANTSYTTQSVRVEVRNFNGSTYDHNVVNVSVFR